MKQLNDINVGFNMNMVNRSIATVTNKRAVAQYINVLLETNTLEVPFKEWMGSGLSDLLGEACSNLNAAVIVEQIRVLIEKYIPYIELQDITYLIDHKGAHRQREGRQHSGRRDPYGDRGPAERGKVLALKPPFRA